MPARRFTTSRRSLLKLAGAAGLAAGGSVTGELAGAGSAWAQPAPAIAKRATLTVSTWGGVTSDGIRDYVGPEFEKLTGASLAFDIGGQGARYNKLLAQKGNPSCDVFFGTDEAVLGGLRAGVLQTADRRAIPNYAELYDWSVTVKPQDAAAVAGVPYTLISYVLAYNPETVKTKPTSWADLWRPEFQGKLAFAAPGHSTMPALVVIAAELAGGSATNTEPGFVKLAQLRPDKLTFFWTDWAPLLKTGDTNAATEFDYYLETMKAQGYPIDYVFPSEGAIGAAECVAMVAGTPNREIAQAFMNLIIDAKVQQAFAEKTYQGPTNSRVEVSGSVAAKMSYGPAKLKQIRFFDPAIAVDNRAAWTERLNTEVVPDWSAR